MTCIRECKSVFYHFAVKNDEVSFAIKSVSHTTILAIKFLGSSKK